MRYRVSIVANDYELSPFQWVEGAAFSRIVYIFAYLKRGTRLRIHVRFSNSTEWKENQERYSQGARTADTTSYSQDEADRGILRETVLQVFRRGR